MGLFLPHDDVQITNRNAETGYNYVCGESWAPGFSSRHDAYETVLRCECCE